MSEFLELRLDQPLTSPTMKVVCAGFELGTWRAVQLAKYLIRDCLLDFALTQDEKAATSPTNAGRQLADAAEWLYKSERYKSRGEIGELLLHVILKQFYGTRAVVTKIYFKDSPNDTVKGFDSVHVSGKAPNLDLWLGEVKFYKAASEAIADVIAELKSHLQRDYLRTEFIAIARKLDANEVDAATVKQMTDKNKSLDSVFARLCIPVLLTYESKTISSFREASDAFHAALKTETDKLFSSFKGSLPPVTARIHLCLLPLGNKETLTTSVHDLVKACQILN